MVARISFAVAILFSVLYLLHTSDQPHAKEPVDAAQPSALTEEQKLQARLKKYRDDRRQQRIELIDRLRGESHDESIALLVSLDPYLRNNYMLSKGKFALENGIVHTDFEGIDPRHHTKAVVQILSNRRFLKVLHESRDDPHRSTKLLGNAIIESLSAYDGAYQTLVEREIERPNSNAGPGLFGTRRGDPVRNPSVDGLRLKIFSCLLALSHLKDEEAREIVRAVVDRAMQQRESLVTQKELAFDHMFRCWSSSLFNKRILATALIETSGREDLTARYEWEDTRLNPFDSPMVLYERADHGGGGFAGGMGSPIQYADEVITLRIVAPLTDDEFRVLLSEFEETSP